MPGGISLLLSLPADIPTPSAGKATIFIDITTGTPSYKDDTGTVSPLGTTGAAGPNGATGPAGPMALFLEDAISGEDGIPGPPGAAGSGSGSSFLATLRQTSDLVNATVTPADLPGLVFTFQANKVYVIDLYMMCTSAAASTGYAFCFDLSAAVTWVGLQFIHQLATTGTLSGGDAVLDGFARSTSSGVPNNTDLNFVHGKAIIVTSGSGGTAQLQFRPEVAFSATCKENSVMRVQELA